MEIVSETADVIDIAEIPETPMLSCQFDTTASGSKSSRG